MKFEGSVLDAAVTLFQIDEFIFSKRTKHSFVIHLRFNEGERFPQRLINHKNSSKDLFVYKTNMIFNTGNKSHINSNHTPYKYMLVQLSLYSIWTV